MPLRSSVRVDRPRGGEQPLPAGRGHTRALTPLVVMFLGVGLSTAIAGPFLTLFLTSAVHASSVQISLFMIVQPLSGVAGATVLGRMSDGRFQRRHILVLTAVAGIASSLCFATFRNYWLLLFLGCTLNALAGAVMAQGFAYARAVLVDDPSAAMVTSTLRTFFSVAWVVGPPLASVVLNTGGFRWLYVSAAGLYAVAAAVGAFWLAEPGGSAAKSASGDIGHTGPADSGRGVIWLSVAGITAIQSSLGLNVQAMPLHIRDDLHGGVGATGLVLGLCAGLEIPIMLGFGVLSTRIPLWKLLRLGPAFGLAYFIIAASATHVWQLAAAQLLNATYIAIVAGLAISYVQELLPSQPGRASTLYSNAFPCGAILASPLLGLGVNFGYRIPYIAAGTLAALGMVLLTAGARVRRRDAVSVSEAAS